MKLHRKLFWLLVLLLPTQLGRHFWPDWTQVLGLPVDYLSPTLYLTDILVVAILGTWLWSKIRNARFAGFLRNGKLEIGNYTKRYWWIGAIFLYLLITSLLAQNSGVALYKFIKIVEFTFLGFYVARNNYSLLDVRYPLSSAVIYSSLIAIAQFIKQASLGGPFWWLGERTFNLITPGIAKAIINGRLIMRPYATFPHPNVLAGFILVSLILIVTCNTTYVTRKILKWTALVLGGITLVLSFSRSVWLVGIMVSLWLVVRGRWRKKKEVLVVFGLILFLILISSFFSFFVSSLSSQETITQRLALIEVAIRMVKTNPIAGVGLNNFIPQLPNYWQQFGMTYWLQPVHNIFLLIAAETGITGLLIFLWLLILTFKKLLVADRWLLITVLSIILALGLFDHYWLTLQQTQLLFSLIFGLSWRR